MRVRFSDLINEDDNDTANFGNMTYTKASKRRIRNMVLDGVDAERRKFKIKKAIVIPIAVVLTLFCVTVIASNYSNNFRMFLKDNLGLFEKKVETVNQSVSNGEITMTVESSINLGSSALTLVKFTKDDGSSFSKYNDFRTLGIYKFNSNDTSFQEYFTKHHDDDFINFTEKIKTDDNKALYYLITVANAADLSEQDYTMCADRLVYDMQDVIMSDINIEVLFNEQPIYSDDNNYNIDVQNFSIYFIDEYCPVTFEGIAKSTDKLFLYFDVSKKAFSDEYTYYSNEFSVHSLFDVKTGDYVNVSNTYWYDSPLSEDLFRYCVEFEAADINNSPNCKILAFTRYYAFMSKYSREKPFYEKALSMPVIFEKGEDSIEKVFEPHFRINGTIFNINKISLSSIGLYVEGNIAGTDWLSFNGLSNFPIHLVYENGGTLKLNRSYMGRIDINEGAINNEFHSKSTGYVESRMVPLAEAVDLKHPAQYELIDISKVVAVKIGEEVIELR